MEEEHGAVLVLKLFILWVCVCGCGCAFDLQQTFKCTDLDNLLHLLCLRPVEFSFHQLDSVHSWVTPPLSWMRHVAIARAACQWLFRTFSQWELISPWRESKSPETSAHLKATPSSPKPPPRCSSHPSSSYGLQDQHLYHQWGTLGGSCYRVKPQTRKSYMWDTLSHRLDTFEPVIINWNSICPLILKGSLSPYIHNWTINNH